MDPPHKRGHVRGSGPREGLLTRWPPKRFKNTATVLHLAPRMQEGVRKEGECPRKRTRRRLSPCTRRSRGEPGRLGEYVSDEMIEHADLPGGEERSGGRSLDPTGSVWPAALDGL